jgi:hypothetical protein
MRHSPHFQQLLDDTLLDSAHAQCLFPALLERDHTNQPVPSSWQADLLALRERRLAIRNAVLAHENLAEVEYDMKGIIPVRYVIVSCVFLISCFYVLSCRFSRCGSLQHGRRLRRLLCAYVLSSVCKCVRVCHEVLKHRASTSRSAQRLALHRPRAQNRRSVPLAIAQGFERPANLRVVNNKIMPVPDYDAVTAGNAQPVRTPLFNPLRDLLTRVGETAAGRAALGPAPASSFNCAIVYDLTALGDGGLFTERIVTPMFQALAFELSTKGAQQSCFCFHNTLS